MKGQPILCRMRYAATGIAKAFRTEQSFRIHCGVALGALMALVVLHPAPVWWAALAIIASLVMAFELINSALEALIDRIHPELHPAIKVAKDMASGAVMVAGAAALIVAACLLVDRRQVWLGWFGAP